MADFGYLWRFEEGMILRLYFFVLYPESYVALKLSQPRVSEFFWRASHGRGRRQPYHGAPWVCSSLEIPWTGLWESFLAPFSFEMPHDPELTRRNARTLTFHFSSTVSHSLDSSLEAQLDIIPKKTTISPKSGPSGPVLPKIGAFLDIFWLFWQNIHIVTRELLHWSFCSSVCPSRYYLLLIALTPPKIGQHGPDMTFFGNFGPFFTPFFGI